MLEYTAAFFARVIKPKSWYKIGKPSGNRSYIQGAFETYSLQLECELASSPSGGLARLTKAAPDSLSPRQRNQSKVQKYVLGPDDQCALVVRPGSLSVIEHVVRLMPYVHHDKTLLLCFLGYIKNHRDLQEKQRDIGMSPSTTHGRDDVGATTASLISGLYRSLTDEKKEELLLAELQGIFAFFLYDTDRKQAFAARDPSGEQELYFCLDEDGTVAFTNSLENLPDSENANKWLELPPGHYISGKTPVLRQFALTPEELESLHELQSSGYIDHLWEDIEEDEKYSPVSVHGGLSPSPDSKPGFFHRLSKRMIPGV